MWYLFLDKDSNVVDVFITYCKDLTYFGVIVIILFQNLLRRYMYIHNVYEQFTLILRKII